MPYDGNGNYSVPAGTQGVPGEIIDAIVYNIFLNDLQIALTKAFTRDGQSTALANIPMGGYRLTGLGNGVAAQDAATMSQLAGAQLSSRSAEAGGTANAITVDLTPAVVTLDDAPVFWRATAASTSSVPTINRNGLGAKTIVKHNNIGLSPGDIPGEGAWMASIYDATLNKEILLNPASPSLASLNVWTGGQVVAQITLTSSASIAVHSELSNNFRLVYAHSFNLQSPVSKLAGMVLNFVFQHDATGTVYVPTFDPIFTFAGGSPPTFTNTANAIDLMSCYYDGVAFRCVMNNAFA